MAGEAWRQITGSVAEQYQQNLVPSMFAPWAPRTVAAGEVRAGDRVLDVACGSGVVTRLAAEHAGAGGSVTGLDVNAGMLAVARAVPSPGGARITWIEANALAMPFPDASFDVVLCQHGLQQMPDPLAVLREMRRVLTPGGRLAITVWGPIERNPGMAALVDALARHVGPAAADNRRAPFALGDVARLRELIEQAGFRDVEPRTEVEPASFPTPESIFTYQAAATPLATTGALDDATRAAIERDLRAALGCHVIDGVFAPPTVAHIVTGRA